MVGVPVAAFGYSAVALMLPHLKLAEGLTRTSADYEKAVEGERERLSGQWKLSGIERAGKAVPDGEVPAWRLTLEGNRFTWTKENGETAGVYGLGLRRNPPLIDLSAMTGPDAGTMWTNGIYLLEGDRLAVCLAPPNTYGENLPSKFSTKGTKNELLVWKRER
jgi:uncharacterized protein (TIGR03067 family)